MIAALHHAKRKNFVVDRLAERLDVHAGDLEAVLAELEERGEIVRSGKGRIALAERLGCVVGRVQAGRSGRAVVVTDDGGPPVSLSASGLRPAMHSDRVLVELDPYTRRGLRSGRVRKVLERGQRMLVGELHRSEGGVVLVPRDPRYGTIPRVVDAPDVAAGTLVAGEFLEYPTSYNDGKVKITEAIGEIGTLPTEIDAVCRTLGIPTRFPDDVIAEAERALANEDPPHRVREDLRELLTLTIDPADAKDHDDAVAVETTEHGFRLVVSIADVSHFVRPGGALDLEARERGNSVYFPGRCVPMLPEELSGDAASLKAGVDRRTMSAILEIGNDGAVHAERFASSWIRSRRLFTYEEVQAVLDGKGSVEAEIKKALRAMEACALALNAKRMARGALDMDLPETQVTVDAEGHPVAVKRRERLFAHRLIEEFMLAANEAVARHLERARFPFLYRIHEAPDDRAIADLVPRLRNFGLRLRHDGSDLGPQDLRAVIEQIRGKPAERVVNMLVLRAMQQARYSPYKQIHFGLASDCYTHFTSPIRRYPDLLVHRALRASLEHDRTALAAASTLEPVAALASRRERRAMEAERDVGRAAGILLMQHHVGKKFGGTVVYVDRNGYAVELDEFFVEGFVPVGRLSEYYTFVSERVELQSRTSGRSIRLGDRTRVRIVSAELAGRRLECSPADPTA